ncbi:MAG: ATP-binding protein [Synergistaceae bacterium]|nr:ATP-binding protein [Synergistaceae bacterium]MBR0168643.1 ATP-binding protein [Synergistaceae bacterium]
MKINIQQKSLTGEIFRRSLFVFILADLTYRLGPLIDGIVTGNFLGVDAVAATSLISPLILILTLVGIIFAVGSQSVYTELLGQGKVDEANSVFTFSNVLAVIVSLLIMLSILIFSDSIVRILGGKPGTASANYAADYLCGYAPGLMFFSCAKVVQVLMNIDNDNSCIVYAIIAMTFVNIAGDFYVVLFTDMKMFGLALATSLSYVAYFGVLMLHFRREKRILHLNFKALNFLQTFLEIFTRGSMPAFSRLSKSIANIIINHAIIFYAGSKALAVFGVQKQIESLVGSLYLGTAEMILAMSNVYYGEEDKKSLDDLQITSMSTGIFLSAIVSVLLLVFSEFFAGLYLGRENLQILSMGAEAVRYMAFTLPFYVLIFGFLNYLQGVKRVFSANIFVFLIQVLVPLSTIYATLRFTSKGPWCATLYSSVILALMCLGYIVIQKVPVNFKKRLLLNSNFYTETAKELELVADSELEVMGMSRIAHLFCAENNLDKRSAFMLSLCIEEFGMNIIKHGFNDGKEHYIYLRILVKEDKIILRIRDDCVAFNPLEYYKMTSQNEDDPTKNIGIRMVVKMCLDIIYLGIFNTNNLVITISKEQSQTPATCKFVGNFSSSVL